MCLLFFSYKTTPGYRLVVAANRDEFLSRPTEPLGFLNKEKTILGGLDLQGGGTWLGITSKVKYAALTNYREPTTTKPNAPSRGEILNEYLAGNTSARQYMDSLVEKGDHYNGFNLILGDGLELYYYSNRLVIPTLLWPGFYGLSNHLLDTPWPKIVRGKNLLRPHMVETGEIDAERIFALLGDTLRPPDEQLPQTGVGLEWERLLSSIFIDGSVYGTRSSAVITVSNEGCINFIEKSFWRDPMGKNNSENVRISLGDELKGRSK